MTVLEGFRSLAHAAEQRCVSVVSLRKAIAQGQLPARRVGRRWCVTFSDLDEWQLSHDYAMQTFLRPFSGCRSAAAVARECGVPWITVRQAIASGQLPARKVRGRWWVADTDLDAWRLAA